MTFTKLTIAPAENGFVVTGQSWTSYYVFVHETWASLCGWLQTVEVKTGPRPEFQSGDIMPSPTPTWSGTVSVQDGERPLNIPVLFETPH